MSTAAPLSTTTSLLDPDEQRVIEEQRARRLHRLALRELWSVAVFAGGFLVVAVLMAVLLPSSRDPGVAASIVLVLAYAAAFRLDFEIGTGSAIPTELILVPMLFVLPVGLVPLAVAAGVVIGSLDECVRGSLRFGRVPMRVMIAWHAVGPALVLGLAGERPPKLSDWPLYLLALFSQFALDTLCAAGREWMALGVRPSVQLRAMVWVYSIDAGLAPVGLAVAFAAESSPYGVLLALPLVALLSVFARERRVRIDHELELRDAYRGTAFLLGDVVEADDEYTGVHSRDVVELTLRVADELGLSTRERRDAEFAALLHDVGKVRIPNTIINKPGPLTVEERAVMEQHTIEGERLLLRVGGLLGEIGRIVRSCHERWDGEGYPDGLAGEEIPLIARIVACCDAYNAMTSDRSYRKALPQEVAVEELRKCSGTQFDPAVVDALITALGR
ncbi:MAG TPA: HD-GYP domain-containing protein [Gaiellaceae bacterium]|jgi:HD-GYP domain-containing protein (c-di-GMP phosphodiesterase class II)